MLVLSDFYFIFKDKTPNWTSLSQVGDSQPGHLPEKYDCDDLTFSENLKFLEFQTLFWDLKSLRFVIGDRFTNEVLTPLTDYSEFTENQLLIQQTRDKIHFLVRLSSIELFIFHLFWKIISVNDRVIISRCVKLICWTILFTKSFYRRVSIVLCFSFSKERLPNSFSCVCKLKHNLFFEILINFIWASTKTRFLISDLPWFSAVTANRLTCLLLVCLICWFVGDYGKTVLICWCIDVWQERNDVRCNFGHKINTQSKSS